MAGSKCTIQSPSATEMASGMGTKRPISEALGMKGKRKNANRALGGK